MCFFKNGFIILFSLMTLSGLKAATDTDPVDVKVYYEENDEGGYDFFAENTGFCDYTIRIHFTKLKNLQASEDLPFVKLIHAEKKKVFLFNLALKKQGKHLFNYNVELFMGDPVNAKHVENHPYLLPFLHQASFKVDQGYFGKTTHAGKYALDFDMPKGTKICATRAGKVVKIKENSNRGGSKPSFQDFGNYILILHDDGSFASYFHLKKNGVLVEPGQHVETGQVIALSGNTGWASGPHLHFEVYIPGFKNNITVPTKFLIDKDTVVSLEEGKTYTGYHPK